MRLLNLGCGSRFHPSWVNVDIVSTGPGVIAHDLSQGIPFADETCDVVYHSHVLEHLRRSDAERFMRDCFRVLRPGGILRVAVPDLERICRTYLCKLEAALRGDADAADDYDWILLEMYDQTVREESGGEMKRYLARPTLHNEAFVYERIGAEGRELRKLLMEHGNTAPAHGPWALARSLVRSLARRLRDRAGRALSTFDARESRIGRFRLAGEVHQWMYDRWSLARLMTGAGFLNPIVLSPTESMIADWELFHLDTASDGSVTKPDSLYLEAKRPEA